MHTNSPMSQSESSALTHVCGYERLKVRVLNSWEILSDTQARRQLAPTMWFMSHLQTLLGFCLMSALRRAEARVHALKRLEAWVHRSCRATFFAFSFNTYDHLSLCCQRKLQLLRLVLCLQVGKLWGTNHLILLDHDHISYYKVSLIKQKSYRKLSLQIAPQNWEDLPAFRRLRHLCIACSYNLLKFSHFTNIPNVFESSNHALNTDTKWKCPTGSRLPAIWHCAARLEIALIAHINSQVQSRSGGRQQLINSLCSIHK